MTKESIRKVNPDFKASLVQTSLDLGKRLLEDSLLLKTEEEKVSNRLLANVFRKHWQNETTPPTNGKINVAIRIQTDDGETSTLTAQPEDLLNVDRSAMHWKGSNMNGGTGEAWVIITKVAEDGTTTSTETKVSPHEYQTENGQTACSLKLDELKSSDALSRGAMFRNKQVLFS